MLNTLSDKRYPLSVSIHPQDFPENLSKISIRVWIKEMWVSKLHDCRFQVEFSTPSQFLQIVTLSFEISTESSSVISKISTLSSLNPVGGGCSLEPEKYSILYIVLDLESPFCIASKNVYNKLYSFASHFPFAHHTSIFGPFCLLLIPQIKILKPNL